MPTYQRSAIHTVDDIRAIADNAGSHFFDAATMRFFDSRTLDGIYALDGNAAREGARFLFITSERHGDAPRHYTVRALTLATRHLDRPAVDIATVGGYHDSARAARAAAQREADTQAYLNA